MEKLRTRKVEIRLNEAEISYLCLLYTSDAADE